MVGRRRSERGVSYLELIATAAILAILASAILPLGRVAQRRHDEIELRRSLRTMRRAIDQYKAAVDQGLIGGTDVKLGSEGYPEEDVRSMAAFFAELFPLAEDPSPAGQRIYDALLATYRDEPWFARAAAITGIKTPLDDPVLDRWRKIWSVDPVDHWSRVTCPVFQTWGADDPLVDAARSMARMDELIETTGQTNFTSIVYPSPADHGVGSANTPTYFDDLANWFSNEVGPR